MLWGTRSVTLNVNILPDAEIGIVISAFGDISSCTYSWNGIRSKRHSEILLSLKFKLYVLSI